MYQWLERGVSVVGEVNTTNVIVFLLLLLGCYWLFSSPSTLPPGPPGLPVVGNLLSIRDPSKLLPKVDTWRAKYGDIFTVRLGSKYAVIVSSYKLVHELFVKNSAVLAGRPTNLYTISQMISRSGIGVVWNDGPAWKELRRVTLMAMRDLGLGKTSVQERVQEEARALVAEIIERGQGQGRPVTTVKGLMSLATSNVISSFTFGRRFDYDDVVLHKLLTMMDDMVAQPFVFAGVNFVPALRILPSAQKVVDSLCETVEALDNYVGKMLAEHEDTYDPAQVRDFVDLYIKTRSESQDKRLYSAGHMRRVIVDLFGAGTETTATTLHWTILYLIAYPDVQTRCQKEIDQVVGDGRPVTYDDRKNLPYVEAVITEIWRVVTVAPLGVPHMTVKEVEVGGYRVPADTIVMSNIHTIHQDPQFWSEPHRFLPDRFLDQEGRFCPPKENYLPFSIGTRVCLGEALARTEAFIFLATLLQTFTFSMGQGRKPDLQGHLGLTLGAREQPIIFTCR